MKKTKRHKVCVALDDVENAWLDKLSSWWGYNKAQTIRFCLELEANVIVLCDADEAKELILMEVEKTKREAFWATSWLGLVKPMTSRNE